MHRADGRERASLARGALLALLVALSSCTSLGLGKMISVPWNERTTDLNTPEAVALVQGAGLLTERFGEWPSFEDAEVRRLSLDRGNHEWVVQTERWAERIPPCLTVTFYVFDNRFSDDDPRRNPAEVAIKFCELDQVEIDGFNHQNPILGLSICLVCSPERRRQMFLVEWGGTALKHEVRFLCEQVHIESMASEA